MKSSDIGQVIGEIRHIRAHVCESIFLFSYEFSLTHFLSPQNYVFSRHGVVLKSSVLSKLRFGRGSAQYDQNKRARLAGGPGHLST